MHALPPSTFHRRAAGHSTHRALCRNNCRTGPTNRAQASKTQRRKRCTCMGMHKIDIYIVILRPYTSAEARTIDVLRAISPAGSHLERQDTRIPACHVQQPTTEHRAMQRCANMLHSRRLRSRERPLTARASVRADRRNDPREALVGTSRGHPVPPPRGFGPVRGGHRGRRDGPQHEAPPLIKYT